MIEVIVPVHHQHQVEYFISKSGRNFCVSTPFLASGLEHTTQVTDLKPIVDCVKKENAQLGLLINRLILESEFMHFEKEVANILAIFTPDYFIVSDVGVMFYLNETYKIPVYFHSDTTIANAKDGAVILEHGASMIMPARELTLKKKLALIESLPNQIMIPLFGYQVMSKSYRPLLTNYLDEIKVSAPIKNKLFYFKESKREEYYLGFEDAHGFSMYTHAIMDLITEKPQLEAAGLKYGWLDPSFIEDELIGAVIMYFHDRINIAQMLEVIHQYDKQHIFNKGLHYRDTSLTKEQVNE